MLNEQTMEKMNGMKLSAMAEALEQQIGSGEHAKLSFEERIGLLIDCEWTAREQRKLSRRLYRANDRAPVAALDVTWRTVGGHAGLTCGCAASGGGVEIGHVNDVSDDLAYKIVKTLYANWPELAKVKKKAIEDSKPENALMGARIPVHPGAMRYYKEMGIVK